MENTKKILTKNEKIYNNKIIYKNDNSKIDKDTKNTIKNTILSIMNNQKEYSKDNKYITNLYITQNDYDILVDNLKNIIDFDIVLTFKNVKDGILSSVKNKLNTFEKYEKIEGYSVSIADFLKSIQASIYKKAEHEKRQEFLIAQQKRIQAKLDKERQKARKKANKQVTKKQKASGNLKTKIDD